MCTADIFRQAARQYFEAVKSVEKAREELKKIIIKYIIADADLSKHTELAISENLGLPRSTIRSILVELLDEKVLRVEEIGNVKPYIINDEMGIGIAIDWLNLSFTREEINELLAAKEAKDFHGMMWIAWGASGRDTTRYRGYDADKCLKTLIARFLCYMDEIEGKLREAFGEQTLEELTSLFPEIGSFVKLIEAPLPVAVKWAARDLQEMDEQSSVNDIKRVVVEAYENSLKSVVRKFKKVAYILEEKGYEGLHEFFKGKKPVYFAYQVKNGKKPEYRFRDEYLWAATLALRESCKIGEKIGADPSLLKEARMLADALDLALEKKYRGLNAEGLSLTDWAIRELHKLQK